MYQGSISLFSSRVSFCQLPYFTSILSVLILKRRQTFWLCVQPWSIIVSGTLVTVIIPGLESGPYSGGKRKNIIINRNAKGRGGAAPYGNGWYTDYTNGLNSLHLPVCTPFAMQYGLIAIAIMGGDYFSTL